MDKTKENLRRIRAYDAEEEWKTIKGSHILVKNGEIVAGAGGKFNGEKFYGGSVNKEDSGTKFNYRSHPAYQEGLNHTTKSFENSYFDEEEVIATKEDSKAQLENGRKCWKNTRMVRYQKNKWLGIEEHIKRVMIF